VHVIFRTFKDATKLYNTKNAWRNGCTLYWTNNFKLELQNFKAHIFGTGKQWKAITRPEHVHKRPIQCGAAAVYPEVMAIAA
jgi:hypothetical protein